MKKFFSLFAAVLFAGSMMAADVTDVLNRELTGQSGTTYAAWSGKTATSDAVYAGQSAGGNDAIQLRSNNSNSGIVTTASGGTLKSITVTFNSNTAAGRTVDVYASNSAYTQATDLYGDNKGTKVASLTASATSYTFTDEYQFIGIRSNSGALYLDKVEIVWTVGGDPTPVVEYYVVGSMNNWELSADYKLAANPAQDGEYMKRFTFAANDELKVRKAIDGELDAWYPEGVGNNWVITEDGQYDVYFRPEGNTEWANGYFFVAPYVIPQYEVAEAIAAGLTDGTEIKVRGVVSKISLKGKNFASYGSACIYVADANGEAGEFEFYNCYAVGSAKFTTTDPAYDATSTAWAEFTEVATADGYAIHVGDTVIAQGKYKLYNTTYELDQNCFIIYAKAPEADYPTAIDNTNIDAKAVKFFENGQLIIIKNGVRYNAQGAVVR